MFALWLIAFAPARLLAEAPCTGDCNGDGSVTVNEVVALVRTLLNEVPVSTCGSGDANADGQVTVNEIVLAVNSLLGGCGVSRANGSIEGDEQCDDGGICLGTAKAGNSCTAESECWTPERCLERRLPRWYDTIPILQPPLRLPRWPLRGVLDRWWRWLLGSLHPRKAPAIHCSLRIGFHNALTSPSRFAFRSNLC
jgi:hypothetical protein